MSVSNIRQIKEAGITLNKGKCELSKDRFTYLGQVISSSELQPDPEKVRAILKLKELKNTSNVRQS